MFEVGFTELLLIFALALVVLGPERLPKLASQVGRWIGRARAMARQFREQLEEEASLEERRPTRRAPTPETQPVADPPLTGAATADDIPASDTRQPGANTPPASGAAPRDFIPGDDDFRHNDTPDHAAPGSSSDKAADERGT